ncbi:unnamed protein product [Gulo gulo]|uniref:Uncharacterized protein n=1 Tax=Gulo gulo TaxID=48420 RepID=A0A9X9M714_GULGU|nr:unnamed protein product [Gulo gulo]
MHESGLLKYILRKIVVAGSYHKTMRQTSFRMTRMDEKNMAPLQNG